MAIQYLMHLGICVRDLERSIRFYRDGLGFEEAGGLEPLGTTILEHTRIHDEEYDSHIVYITDPDGTRLEVIQVPNDPTR